LPRHKPGSERDGQVRRRQWYKRSARRRRPPRCHGGPLELHRSPVDGGQRRREATPELGLAKVSRSTEKFVGESIDRAWISEIQLTHFHVLHFGNTMSFRGSLPTSSFCICKLDQSSRPPQILKKNSFMPITRTWRATLLWRY
jgi:hypothetical protein